MSDWQVIEADCVEAMRTMPAASVDAVVTDPPYGLGFMGKEWDTAGAMHLPPSATALDSPLARMRTGKGPAAVAFDGRAFQAWCEQWAREALRVLKPGGHLLAFGGTRTYHRLACAIEDAGFEIRDTIAWMYGTGFPKSLNVGDGWGTSLKPAHEPIVVARKPLAGTVAANVLAHGTGALNVGECRIGTEKRVPGSPKVAAASTHTVSLPGYDGGSGHDPNVGRWPANVMLDPDAAAMLDEQTGELTSGRLEPHHYRGQPRFQNTYGDCNGGERATESSFGDDSGGASRFFATFDHQEDPWTSSDASNAPSSTGPSDERNGSALAPARDERLPEREASDPPTSESVWSADDGSRTTPATDQGTTAPTPAGQPPSAPSAPAASDAGDPADSCATDSARASAPPDRSAADPATRGPRSGEQHDEPTPTRSHASTAERRVSSDITSSTTIPPSSSGSAPPVTPPDIPADPLASGGDLTRFRYCPKSSSAERNAGLDGFERKQNVHPTVKPIDLMRWLVRLVTPPGGTVLDPFTGSGTTGCAAMLEGFRFVGIEREPEYAQIARARIAWWTEHPDGIELVQRLEHERERKAVTESGQLDIFEGAA